MRTEPISSWDLKEGDRIALDGLRYQVVDTQGAGLADWLELVGVDDVHNTRRHIDKQSIPVVDREVSA